MNKVRIKVKNIQKKVMNDTKSLVDTVKLFDPMSEIKNDMSNFLNDVDIFNISTDNTLLKNKQGKETKIDLMDNLIDSIIDNKKK